MTQEQPDIYKEDHRINNLLTSIRTGKKYNQYKRKWETIDLKPEVNKKYLLDFYTKLQSERLHPVRVMHYVQIMRDLTLELGKDWKKATSQDLEKLLADAKQRGLGANTMSFYAQALKKFYRWLLNWTDKHAEPPIVSGISTGVKTSEQTTINPNSLITKAEIDAMINATSCSRERAFLATLWESGLRPSEIITLQNTNLRFEEGGVRVCLGKGKTGGREILLIDAEPYLVKWQSEHPNPEPNSYLWLPNQDASTKAVKENQLPSYESFAYMIKKLAHKAGITKRVNLYVFRHTALTELGKMGFSQYLIAQRGGHRPDSKTTAKYMHFDKDQANQKFKENRKGGAKMEQCPRCKTTYTPNQSRCFNCGMVFDKKQTQGILKYSGIEAHLLANVQEKLKSELKTVIRQELEKLIKKQESKAK